MAKQYKKSLATKVINGVFRSLTRLGLGASYRWVLTVPGRKTGRLYSTPVDVMDHDGALWLVAAYGPSNWVSNARFAGRVNLARGKERADYEVRDVAPSEAVPVLRQYMTQVPVTRPYFDASPDSSDADIAAELPRHPTLRLVRVA